MSRILAGGFLGVLIAEVVGVLIGWRWALPAAGAAVALFALQVRGNLAGVRGAAQDEATTDPALAQRLDDWRAALSASIPEEPIDD